MSIRLAFLPCLCLALLSFIAQAAEKRLDRTFAVTPGGHLTVDADGSDIAVSGTDSAEVVVQIVMTGSQRAVDAMITSAEQTADGVAVTARRRSGSWFDWLWSGGRMTSRVTVKVPRRYNLDLKTSGGNLAVAQLQGDALGRTSGGDVRVGNVQGPVRMQTSGGDIVVEGINGNTEIHTSGGDITARTVTGSLDAKTSGGSIRLQQIRGATRARTSSGDVMATNVRGDVDLQSSGGNINAEAIDGRIRAGTSGGNVEAELLGANRGISATSSGGNIVLHVPKDVGALLNASTSGGSITSDLPVSTTEAGERKLSGTINGGGEPIHARDRKSVV